ncbi:unnamed protein product, partial [Schistosoma margrebowiei]
MAVPVKKPKSSKPKVLASHPPVINMIIEVIFAVKDGTSRRTLPRCEQPGSDDRPHISNSTPDHCIHNQPPSSIPIILPTSTFKPKLPPPEHLSKKLYERRLGADEAPLLVQLNWTAENQEGRFILRDESKPQTITRPDSNYQNGSATIITSTSTTHGLKQRKNSKNLLTTENNTDDKQTRGFVRRWSSGSRKKQRKSSKNRSDLIDDELEQVPDTT